MKKLVFMAMLAVVCTSCTRQEVAKRFGGTANVKLEPNEEIICATFKDNDIWITCKNTVTGEVYMRESSSFGILEGRINFVKEK